MMFDFLRSLGSRSLTRKNKKNKKGADATARRRSLFLEPLEERQMLAADLALDISVDGGGSFVPVANQSISEAVAANPNIQFRVTATETGGGATFTENAFFQIDFVSLSSVGGLVGDFNQDGDGDFVFQDIDASLAAGQPSPVTRIVQIDQVDDVIVEGVETFQATLQATADGGGSGTLNFLTAQTFEIEVTDDDAANVTITSPTVAEDVAAGTVTLNVATDLEIDSVFTVGFTTTDGAGAKDARTVDGIDGTGDYDSNTGTSGLQAAGSNFDIVVDINDDTVMELATEQFTVDLSEVTGLIAAGYNITLAAAGTVTITDTDTFAWAETIDPVSEEEGPFDVNTDGITGGYEIYGGLAANQIQVTVAAVDGTAREAGAGVGSDDYDISSFTGGLLSNETITRTAIATANEDAVVEHDETFDVEFTITDDQGFGGLITSSPATQQVTIRNDDATTIRFSADFAEVETGATFLSSVFSVNSDLDIEVTAAFAINIDSLAGSATDGELFVGDDDYQEKSSTFGLGVWTGEAGTPINSTTVQIKGDAIVETNETFQFVMDDGVDTDLDGFAGEMIADGTAAITLAGIASATPLNITIINDDLATISITTAASLVETNGATTHTYTVDSTADIQTIDGTTGLTNDFAIGGTTSADSATIGDVFVGDNDYEEETFAFAGWNGDAPTPVDFPLLGSPGSIGGDDIDINGDEIVEIDESFDITLAVDGLGGTNLAGMGADITVTLTAVPVEITNDDLATISITTAASLVETDGATTHAFTVDSDADIQTIDGTTGLTNNFAIGYATSDDSATSSGTFTGALDFTALANAFGGWDGDSPAGDTFFTPGSIGGTDIAINGELTVELDESFDIDLPADTVGGTVLAGMAADITLTTPASVEITNDDTTVLRFNPVSISTAELNQADGVTNDLAFQVESDFNVQVIDGSTGLPITFQIDAETLDGLDSDDARAAAGSVGDGDYTAESYSESAWNGNSTTDVIINDDVNVVTDEIVERDEDMSVDFAATTDIGPYATAPDVDGVPVIGFSDPLDVTILNDDAGTFSIIATNNSEDEDDAQAGESPFTVDLRLDTQVQTYGEGTLDVLSESDEAITSATLDLRTADNDNSATAPYTGSNDYNDADQTLNYTGDVDPTVAPDTQQLEIEADEDTILEFDELFYVAFSESNLLGYATGPVEGSTDFALTITTDITTMTIVNDDAASIDLDILEPTITEGSTGTVTTSLSNQVQTFNYNDNPGYTGSAANAGDTGTLVLDHVTADGDSDFPTATTPSPIAGQMDATVADDGVNGHNDYESAVALVGADIAQTAGTTSFTGDTAESTGAGSSDVDHTLTVNGDETVELAERFSLDFSENDLIGFGAAGTLTFDAQALALIPLEDAATFTITPVDPSVTEGTVENQPGLVDPGTGDAITPVEFQVVLSNDLENYDAAGDKFIVLYNTTDGEQPVTLLPSATDGEDGDVGNGSLDYKREIGLIANLGQADNSELIFDGNAGEQVVAILQINADEVVELDEFFVLDFSEGDFDDFGSVNDADIDDGYGSDDPTGQLTFVNPNHTVTIENDDDAHLEVIDIDVNVESGTVDVIVALDYPVDIPITVEAHHTDGTAVYDDDYTAARDGSPAEPLDTDLPVLITFGDGDDGDAGDPQDDAPSTSSGTPVGYADQSQVVTFNITDETVAELDETFFLNIFNLVQDDSASITGARNVSIGNAMGTVTIVNDDTTVISLTANVAVVQEGNSAEATLSVEDLVDVDYSFDVVTVDGTAGTSAGDYTYTTKTFTILANTTELLADDGTGTLVPDLTFTVPIAPDSIVELDEDFHITTKNINAQGRSIVLGLDATVTIENTTAALLSINDVTFIEGDDDQTLVLMTVTLDTAVDVPVTVDYATAVGSATFENADAGNPLSGELDYQDTSGQLTFVGQAGEQQTIGIYVNGDNVVEAAETLSVALTNPAASGRDVTIDAAAATGTLTIENDDTAVLSIESASSTTEGTAGELVVTLSNPVDVNVTYDHATANGSAIFDGGTLDTADYSDTSATAVTFSNADGASLTQTLSVATSADGVVETAEDFTITIDDLQTSGVVRDVSPGNDTGTITIADNDAATISVSHAVAGDDVSVDEEVGTVTLQVTLDTPVDTAVSVDIGTLGDTATGDVDYVEGTGTLTFNPLDTTAQTFDVTITNDNIVEFNEQLNVLLSNLAAATGRDVTIADGSSTITILNDNTAPTDGSGVDLADDDATLSIQLAATQAASFDEGTNGETTDVNYTITIDNPVAIPVSINYAAVNPASPADFNDFSDTNAAGAADGIGSVTFDALDVAEKTISVSVTGDQTVELDETFTLKVFGLDADGLETFRLDAVSINQSTDSFTVLNDDAAGLSVADVTIIEDDSDKTLVLMTVTLDTAVDVPVTVDYETNAGSAEEFDPADNDGDGFADDVAANYGDNDYVKTSGSLTFVGQVGEQQTLGVYVNGDNVVEAIEQFTVDLVNGTVAADGRDVTIDDGTGTVTITNNDTAVLSIESASSVVEGGTGQLVVTLSNPVDVDVTYDHATADGTALSASDYTDTSAGDVVFSNTDGASLTQTLSVATTADDVVELDEDFTITISDLQPSDGSREVSLGNDTGTITIVNDDSADVRIDDVVVNEDDGTATLTVTLTNEVDVNVDVVFSVVDVTATASDQGGFGVDYTVATASPVTFLAGSQSETITVNINDDIIVEFDELLNVVLDSVDAEDRDVSQLDANGTFDDTGTITIINDDAAQLDIQLATDPAQAASFDEDDNGGLTAVNYTVSIDNPVAIPVSAIYSAINPESPADFDDFVAGTGSVSFDALDVADKTITLNVYGDETVELDETFTLQLFGLDADDLDAAAEVDHDDDAGTADVDVVRIVQTTDSFTVVNDDTATFQINDITVTEDDHGHDNAIFTVTLNDAVDVPVIVDYATVDGSVDDAGAPIATNVNADAGNPLSGELDYVAETGSIVFAGTKGETQTISIRVNGDNVVELTENFSVNLTAIDAPDIDGQAANNRNVSLSFADPGGVATVENDDSATVSIQESVSITEGDSGQSLATLTVTLSAPVDVNVLTDADSDDINVVTAADRADGVATQSGPLVSDDDYNTVDETLTFSNADGADLTLTVDVPVNGDGVVELDEAMDVLLSNLIAIGDPADTARDVSFGNTTGEVNILNNDSANVTINDVTINEEDLTATLNVSLDADVDVDVTVDFQTLDGTALAAFNDYTTQTGIVTFAAETTADQAITVAISNDDIVELHEFLSVGLDEAVAQGRAVTVSDTFVEATTDTDVVATGRIDVLNTDTADITITADQDFFREDDDVNGDGITDATLTVTLSNPVDVPILMTFATANGDYSSINNAALANNDPLAIAAEYLGINSTADNDDPAIIPPFKATGEYDFVNSGLADDHDYDDTEGVLNFEDINDGLQHEDPLTTPGYTGLLTQTITIPVYIDNIVELDEWLSVNLTGFEFLGRNQLVDDDGDAGTPDVPAITVSKPTDFVWIDNDDDADFTIGNVTVIEADAGSILATLVVTLDNDVDVPVTLTYETRDGEVPDPTETDNPAVEADGGVIGDNDYQTQTGTLSFVGAQGETKTISIVVNGDQIVELDEYFTVELIDLEADHRDVTIEDSTGRVDVDNNDQAEVIVFDTVVAEGDSGTADATFDVILTKQVDTAVSIDFTQAGAVLLGGADASDFENADASGTVTFAAGDQEQTVAVTVNGDTDFERHEELRLQFNTVDSAGAEGTQRDVSFSDRNGDGDIDNIGKITIINDDRNPRGLQTRHILHAEPGDVATGAVNVAIFDFSVSDNTRPLDLQFVAAAAPGETLQVGSPQVLDSDGAAVAPLKLNNYGGDNSRAYSVYRLSAGDYTVVVPSQNSTSGLVELLVAMPGILDVGTVEDESMQLSAGGTLQTQLGIRGVSPTVFSDEMGIDLSQTIFEQELDADLNNIITSFDLMTVNTNHLQDAPGIYLIESDITPAAYHEVNTVGNAFGTDEVNIAELFGFSIYQNPTQPLDVNTDGNISPADALAVINELNTTGAKSVLVLDQDSQSLVVNGQFLTDTNGDFSITSQDALYVINRLNVGDAGGPTGEAEAGAEGESLAALASFRYDVASERVEARAELAEPVAASATDAAIADWVGDQQRTAVTGSENSWRDEVEAVFAGVSEGDDLLADDDVFSDLN